MSTTPTPSAAAAPVITDYDSGIDWLMSRLDYERKPATGLDAEGFRASRMRRLLQIAGEPHRKPAVHIAGTKGKGSTAVMVAQMLTASGCKTGLFTSPHLNRLEERFRVDGDLLTPDAVTELVRQLVPMLATIERSDDPFRPTFFELVTILAHLAFTQSECERIVLEVGLGGRLDTTNHCEPEVTIITNISLDHTDLLGETTAEIAAEKAGIIKEGVPVLTAALDPDALAVIRQISAERNAPLFVLGDEIRFQLRSTDEIAVRTPWGEAYVPVPLMGDHQRVNAALATAAMLLLQTNDDRITNETLRSGMAQVRWPLRIEILCQQPVVIVDAAHNEASTQALAKTVLQQWPNRRRVLIFGTSRDKKAREMLTSLQPAFDEVILSRYQNNPRAVPPADLQAIAAPLWPERVSVTKTLTEAWSIAKSRTDAESVIVATGSFFLAAEIREFLLHQNL